MADKTIIKPGSKSAASGYMPQLDTLRTFAVGLVLISHWFPKHHGIQIMPYGMFGVTLFFVLSGFLITRILLKSKDADEELHESKFHSIKQFYIRRTLRIFPVYYITIFILYFFNVSGMKEKFLWFLFYASNIYFFDIQNWSGTLSHFWTLAVEEQFYLIWPFIILFVPRKYLFMSIIAMVFVGPVFRSVMFFIAQSDTVFYDFSELLTPARMDSFGLGAVLAYFTLYKQNDPVFQNKWIKIFMIIYLLAMTLFTFLNPGLSTVVFVNFNMSLLFLFLIAKAAKGFTGFLKIIFENKILMYLGKISYGLYLFHKFIPDIYDSLGLSVIQNLYLRLLIEGLMLVAIASFSWYLIEKPFNNLKRKFAYT